MKVASAAEMNRIDRLAQEEYQVPGIILMEQAAMAVRQVIEERFALASKKVYVFCGKGNNGGDGLALARLLTEKAAEVTVVLADHPSQFHGLALDNLTMVQKSGLPILDWENVNPGELQNADLIVDALLGTGARGAPSGAPAAIISRINDSLKPVVSVDIPSGVNVDNGQIGGVVVKASVTVTFGLPKPGLLIFPGAEMCGELVIAPIGFPRKLLESASLKINWPKEQEVRQLIPKRLPTAHKGLAGHVLVIGGAVGMTGAVALCALGALRAGSGLVTVGTENPNYFPEKPAEVMTLSWERVLTFLEKADAVVFGPGISVQEKSRDLLIELLNNCTVPLVIDADGLNLLAAESLDRSVLNAPLVLTPHPGEMSRLTGLSVAEIQKNRIDVARGFAKKLGVTLVLKGARSIIADQEENIFINPTGNPGMATAGMGDALAGAIGGLLAQGMKPAEAALTGTYLHGLAGDLAVEKYGPAGIITIDLLDEYPVAIKKVLG
ncbi:MAG: NAD(P)H-hydrate dehydratase [Firmicutes bacterium]|nr:NAD(P)H-hydrate dehydratase [Bacillota bacterium]